MDRPHVQGHPELEVCAKYQNLLERGWVDEEELTVGERLGLDEHVSSCPHCRQFLKVMDVFEDVPGIEEKLGAIGGEDLVSGAVEEYFERSQKRAQSRRFKISVLAAAAAVLLAIAALLFQGRGAVNTAGGTDDAVKTAEQTIPLTIVSGEAEINGQPALAGRIFSEGAWLKTPGKQILIAAETALKIGLATNSAIEVKQASQNHVILSLQNGTVAVSLDPRRQLSLEVEAGSHRVRVTGTVFSVERDSQVSVHVVEGAVEVSNIESDEKIARVVESRGYRSDDLRDAPLAVEKKREILRLLQKEDVNEIEADERAEQRVQIDTAETETSPFQRKALDAEVQNRRGQPEQNREEGRSGLSESANMERERVLKVPREKPEGSRKPRPPADYLREARACRARGDWTCAAHAYRKVIEVYPNDPLARTVLVPLAQIELKHLGHPSRSYKLFSDYLRVEPTGPLSQEASYGICKALEAMGEVEKEKRALQKFLQRYPRSAYGPNAENRLRDLSGEAP